MILKPMNKKLHFKKKIDLLLISLEAIDTYSLENIYNKNRLIRSRKKEQIFRLRSGNYTRHPSNNSLCEFEDSIKTIHIIQDVLSNSFTQNMAFTVLNNHYKNPTSIVNQQYIKRFKYIYNKTQNYYSIYSYSINVNLSEIAIINLYIIAQLKTKHGIYLILKYLYSF